MTLQKFELPNKPLINNDSLIAINQLPSLGSKVDSKKFNSFSLQEEISSGGEGTIYRTTISNLVCKIYHKDKLTVFRKKKIELMVTRNIQESGICWPIDPVTYDNVFVGYLMPLAQGKPIQTTLFTKPALLKNFPSWKRTDLIDLAILFVHKIRFLHSLNIIIGDINPLNFLIDKNKNLYFVDTDSYQVENYPCPVGTVNFTAPEIQGCDYSTFLRKKDHELFAVATMIFMILFPGKPPYSQQGGGMLGENIRNKNFPYPCDGESEGIPPEGSWSYIWSNLTKKLRIAFCETYKQDVRKTPDEWTILLEDYKKTISKGILSNELFPLVFPIYDPILTICGECGIKETASKSWVEKMQNENKFFLCGKCRQRIRLKKLMHINFKEQKKILPIGQNAKNNSYHSSYHKTNQSTNPNYQHTHNTSLTQNKPQQNTTINRYSSKDILKLIFLPFKILLLSVADFTVSLLYLLSTGFHSVLILIIIFLVTAFLNKQ